MHIIKLILTLLLILEDVAYGMDSNPVSLSFHPTPPENSKNGSLIWYKANNYETISQWKNQLDKFLEPYTKPLNYDQETIVDCELGVPLNPGSNKVCAVNVHHWYPCVHTYGYGLNSSTGGPCIFLKLDSIAEWIPEYYNFATLPEDMPKHLKDHIKNVEVGYRNNRLKIVWVSCEGEDAADKENIGPMSYFPHFGFGGQYFPSMSGDDYLSPLVAIYFEKPLRGVIINVRCKLWAKNIVDEVSVHFELLVD